MYKIKKKYTKTQLLHRIFTLSLIDFNDFVHVTRAASNDQSIIKIIDY